MEALQQILSLPLSLFTIILWIIIYNLCKLWEKNTPEHGVTFSEQPYGVNTPEVDFKKTSSGRVRSMKESRGQGTLVTEAGPE